MDALTVRAALPEDIAEVAAIERMSFPSPWDTQTFATTLEDKRCLSALVFEGDTLVGYCFALCLSSMVHILNLAVRPGYREKGIGKRLIQDIISQSVAIDKVCAVLEVRKSNKPARSLYASIGFSHVSTWRGYYSDTKEDAEIMVKDLKARGPLDMTCTVVRNIEVAEKTYHLVLEGGLPQAVPGQFAMVQVSWGSEPFLRRPLAVLGQTSDEVELLYRVKGTGTELLAAKRAGERVKVLGPLGKGFTRRTGDRVIYMAGGTGLPPVLALAERMGNGTFIIGARTKRELPLLERVTSIPNTRTVVMTEDGSCGRKGLATDALDFVLGGSTVGEEIVIYACGPEGMLRAGAKLASRKGAYCEISLEEHMSCGFGACAGCVVQTKGGSMRVCRDGPVFAADDIIWG